MLAGLTQVPELAIAQQEAAAMSTAINNVAQHYDVQASQKTVDWGNLIATLSMVYGTRMVAIYSRKKSETPSRAYAPKKPAEKSRGTGTIEVPGIGDINLPEGITP